MQEQTALGLGLGAHTSVSTVVPSSRDRPDNRAIFYPCSHLSAAIPATRPDSTPTPTRLRRAHHALPWLRNPPQGTPNTEDSRWNLQRVHDYFFCSVNMSVAAARKAEKWPAATCSPRAAICGDQGRSGDMRGEMRGRCGGNRIGLSGPLGHSEAIRGHPRPSEAIRGHPRPSEALTSMSRTQSPRPIRVRMHSPR